MITPRYSKVDPTTVISFRIATASGDSQNCRQRYISVKNFKSIKAAYTRAVEIEKELLAEARYTKDYNRIHAQTLSSKYGLVTGLAFSPCIKKPSKSQKSISALYLNVLPYGKVRKLTCLNVFKLGYKKTIEVGIKLYIERLYTKKFTYREVYQCAMQHAPSLETLQAVIDAMADEHGVPRRTIPA